MSRVEGKKGVEVKSGLESFGAYRKSMELFDLVVQDMEPLKSDYSLTRLFSQQLASADSIIK